MARAIAVVAVLGVCLSQAAGEPFNVNRDNSVLGYSSEQLINCGANSYNRLAKRSEHIMVMDFDTQAILDWQTANPLGAGQYYQYELFLKPQSYDATETENVKIQTLNAKEDWAEGDGDWNTTYASYNWTKTMGASVYNYAQCWYTDTDGVPGSGDEVLDTVNSKTWQDKDGNAFDVYNLPSNYQSAYEWIHPGTTGVYEGVILDDDLDPTNTNLMVDDLLNNAINRGLKTYRYEKSNSRVYFSESAGSEPYLEVTIVPEPATMVLMGLGFGGLAVLRRRKK